MEKNSSVNY